MLFFEVILVGKRKEKRVSSLPRFATSWFLIRVGTREIVTKRAVLELLLGLISY